MMQTKDQFFDGTEFVNDILGKMPEAMDVLLSHGLGCAGCQFNMFETLEQGVIGHGFSYEDLGRILKDLNEAAEDLGLKSPPSSRHSHESGNPVKKESLWLTGSRSSRIANRSKLALEHVSDADE